MTESTGADTRRSSESVVRQPRLARYSGGPSGLQKSAAIEASAILAATPRSGAIAAPRDTEARPSHFETLFQLLNENHVFERIELRLMDVHLRPL